ncbi:hypothetical protein SB6419_05104 [Klebsiella spallanzanii]|nr:hypothetical protein SB6419_05104 [Klebsiella spallanzanii]
MGKGFAAVESQCEALIVLIIAKTPWLCIVRVWCQ